MAMLVFILLLLLFDFNNNWSHHEVALYLLFPHLVVEEDPRVQESNSK